MRRLLALLGLITIIGLSLSHLGYTTPAVPLKAPPKPPTQGTSANDIDIDHHRETFVPLDRSSHPIAHLVNNATAQFDAVLNGQSKTLQQAVDEYRRRYKLNPPPHFDAWFKFAQAKGTRMIDEYDNIYDSLLPFWALSPKTIRGRAREAIGFDNAVISLIIRDGAVMRLEGGGEAKEWQRNALKQMIKPFVRYLPDMDLAFNVQDEPRVIVPHDDLNRLVSRANSIITAIGSSKGEQDAPRNSWTQRPDDVNKGDRVEEFRTTRFNSFAHQPTWTHARASCPLDSPARDLSENPADATSAYSIGELGFVYNSTAFSDICLTPSLRDKYGFFARPNAFDVVHDLFPIFSQSKVSSFQDILYPSPWYFDGQVQREASKDVAWKQKEDKMFWRGSTTGGFSREGGWRRQHRQRFVKAINGLGSTKVLEKNNEAGTWGVKDAKRSEYKDLFDVHFSSVSQCDPADCDAQQEYFRVAEVSNQQDVWAYKFLVDIDGNAFSGRYYAFLYSSSLIYKLALFREWHDEWIRPWVHFIPLGIEGGEYVESVRYFVEEDEGKALAQNLAKSSQAWAQSALRNQDLEVWFFRLLLE